MKEDILEQLVDDYLLAKGYFTRHNVKFKPRNDHPEFVSRDDSNHSDIDVLGFHPLLCGPERVIAVSCKSWQGGFDVAAGLRDIAANRRVSGREAWKRFRELVRSKWSEAFIEAIERETGSAQFTYVTAVTVLKGDRALWENEITFQHAMKHNPIRIWTLSDMLAELFPMLGTTVASSQLGRTLQLIKASGWNTVVQTSAGRANCPHKPDKNRQSLGPAAESPRRL
jgi:hypothetical protein